MPQSVEVEKRIREGLPSTHVEVRDLTGEGDHFEVLVVSPAFEGKTRVEQHQLVYSALGEQMKGAIHALSLRTLTPEQREQVSR